MQIVIFSLADNISVQKHAANAAELLLSFNNNLSSLGNAENIPPIYDKRVRNSTTVALVVANIMDKILKKYGSVFDIVYDLTNMSNMMTTASDTVGNTIDSMLTKSQHLEDSKSLRDNDLVLVNPQDYQTAKALSDRVNRLFNDDLTKLSPANETANVVRLEESLEQLKDSVDNKA